MTTHQTTELFGHQRIARKAISLARRANPHLDTTPFLSIEQRKELYSEAVRLLHSSEIRVNWNSLAAQNAKPASSEDKAVAQRCLDWMLLAGIPTKSRSIPGDFWDPTAPAAA